MQAAYSKATAEAAAVVNQPSKVLVPLPANGKSSRRQLMGKADEACFV